MGHYRDYPLLGSGRFEIDGVSEYQELYDVMAQGRDIASRLVVLDAAEGDEIYWLAMNERDEQS